MTGYLIDASVVDRYGVDVVLVNGLSETLDCYHDWLRVGETVIDLTLDMFADRGVPMPNSWVFVGSARLARFACERVSNPALTSRAADDRGVVLRKLT